MREALRGTLWRASWALATHRHHYRLARGPLLGYLGVGDGRGYRGGRRQGLVLELLLLWVMKALLMLLWVPVLHVLLLLQMLLLHVVELRWLLLLLGRAGVKGTARAVRHTVASGVDGHCIGRRVSHCKQANSMSVIKETPHRQYSAHRNLIF